MNESLYYIPIIEAALREAEPVAALKKAFDRIKKIGRQKRYRQGLRNFEIFMDSACQHYEDVKINCLCELMAQMASGASELTEFEKDVLLDVIGSDSKLQYLYQKVTDFQKDDTIDNPIIELHSEGTISGQITFIEGLSRGYIHNIYPGKYSLRLANTNRVIWRGNLTGKDLIWSAAYGPAALELAAETEEINKKATRRINLHDCGIVIGVFAGLENGSIEVELVG